MNPCIISIETSAILPEIEVKWWQVQFRAGNAFYPQNGWKIVPLSYDCLTNTTPSGPMASLLPYLIANNGLACNNLQTSAPDYFLSYPSDGGYNAANKAFGKGTFVSAQSIIGLSGYSYTELYVYYSGVQYPPIPALIGASGKTKFVFELRALSSCNGLTLSLTDPDVWPAGTGGPASTTITARLSQPASAGGCVVDFGTPEPVAASGGHLHVAPPERPHGTLDQPSCTIYEGQTYCINTYASSEVAGEEKIKATLADTGEAAETTITVKVPGLGPVPLSTAYRLTGSYGEPGVSSQHHDNHYLNGSTYVRIINVANDYLDETGDTIGLNDMSLPMGGLFDISNNWAPPHNKHRVGKSVDVDHGVQENLLNKIARKYKGKRYEVDRIHYEFP